MKSILILLLAAAMIAAVGCRSLHQAETIGDYELEIENFHGATGKTYYKISPAGIELWETAGFDNRSVHVMSLRFTYAYQHYYKTAVEAVSWADLEDEYSEFGADDGVDVTILFRDRAIEGEVHLFSTRGPEHLGKLIQLINDTLPRLYHLE